MLNSRNEEQPSLATDGECHGGTPEHPECGDGGPPSLPAFGVPSGSSTLGRGHSTSPCHRGDPISTSAPSLVPCTWEGGIDPSSPWGTGPPWEARPQYTPHMGRGDPTSPLTHGKGDPTLPCTSDTWERPLGPGRRERGMDPSSPWGTGPPPTEPAGPTARRGPFKSQPARGAWPAVTLPRVAARAPP